MALLFNFCFEVVLKVSSLLYPEIKALDISLKISKIQIHNILSSSLVVSNILSD